MNQETLDRIETFLHCKKCYEEKPDGVSMQEFCSIEVAKTATSFLVWCKRHDILIVELDCGCREPTGSKCDCCQC